MSRTRWQRYPTIIFVMWLFFGQLTFGSRHLSMTSDEPPHLINGYVMLKTGNAWAVPVHGHPPLLNMWSAWPLLLQPEQPDPRVIPSWDNDFIKFVRAMWPLLGPIERLAFVTRVPIMLLAMVLMALVYRWAREWFGHWGGVLAMGMMAFDPTLIGHSQLGTTDLGVTLFGFACLYLIHRLLRRFAWRRLIAIGLALGAAAAAKPSGLMLAPVIVALLAWGYMRETGMQWQAWLSKRENSVAPLLHAAGRWLGSAVLVIVAGTLVLWAAYRFEWSTPPLASHVRMLEIFIRQKHGVSFLNGELSSNGWWWYFPFATVIKSPIPYLIAVGVALLLAARKWRAIGDSIALWLFPVVYWATALESDINLGYRHMLPTFPFIYVGLAQLGPALSSSRPSRWRMVARGITAVLAFWYIVGTLRVYPFPLAYFNELIGGPQNGYHYLVDSNVDWGQSFKALKAYMAQAGISSVRLSYYTWIDPAVYGVSYKPMPPAPQGQSLLLRRFDPEPGWYAISASTLQGIMLKDPDTYEWFRHWKPLAQPGYGLLVYQVSPHNLPATWVAQCANPVAPLEPEQIAEGFGRADLRLAYFDCSSSWLIPSNGQSAGWYVLRRETASSGDHFIARWLQQARLSYQQKTAQASPAFVIYEQPARSLESACSGPPSALNGPLSFLGYVAPSEARAGDTIEIETCWQVTAHPQRLLSIMLHLVTPTGMHMVADGLGVPIEQWQAGDLIVQRHKFSIPPGSQGRYQLMTGAYWLDTLERWPVSSGGDSLALGQIAVKSQ